MYKNLLIESAAGIATIWMNRPEVHNAFDELMIDELTRACVALDSDPAIRVVVLAGRGKSFSAGGDLNWMRRAASYTAEENLRDARALARMMRTLAALSKPTIARVHGAALGGGMGLAAACDICITSSNASFATSEVRLGIIPAVIGPYVIRAIGERQARRYFLSAERIGAYRAGEIGLAHEVVEPEALDGKVAEVASALLLGGPQAQKAAKQLIGAVANRPPSAELIEDTAQRIASLRAGEEAAEGLSAFLEKRPAKWTSPDV
jgi:methylglutaconyl-CoA hydratase